MIVLGATLVLAGCSRQKAAMPLATVSRLQATESICGVLLQPPLSTEHPHIRVPTLTALHLNIVGRLPAPDIVYARIPAIESGLGSGTQAVPEWAVIYRHTRLVIHRKMSTHPQTTRSTGEETILSIIDPTTGSSLDLRACSSLQ